MGNQTDNTLRIGQSEVITSRIGVGAMTWGDPLLIPRFDPARLGCGLADSKEEQEKAVDVSIAAGVNFIDTAAMYGMGASELRVGELTKDKPVVLATKFPLRFRPWESSMLKDLNGSLSRLGRASIDLYQLHYPFPWLTTSNVMNQMADAVQAGQIRAIGVSNFSAKQMREAHAILAKRKIPLASNQVEYSLLHRKPEINGVLDACRELGITLIAYMPLAMGVLTGKYTVTIRPTGMRRRMSRFRGNKLAAVIQIVSMLRDIGDRHSKTPAQVALRWLLQHDNVLPIPGAKNAAQASENAGTLSFTLSDSEFDALGWATLQWQKK
ncbi:MAG: aldo/keto reductase [Ignavibacteriae bacterium]|nr:MAG: aldo/keto reductase [Ignavibacteriota bacterium]